MFQNILVPLDMTLKHRLALDMAEKLARQNRGEIILLHVIELLQGMPRSEDSQFYDRLEKAANEHLDKHLVVLKKQGIPCRKEVVFGVRATEVVRFARNMGADLIVVTAPRIDPSHPEEGWGSLCFKLGIFAPCPVLLVK